MNKNTDFSDPLLNEQTMIFCLRDVWRKKMKLFFYCFYHNMWFNKAFSFQTE